jgi:hypothetical protein
MRPIHSGITAISIVLSACTSIPKFEKTDSVTPGVIVDVIQCELIEARNKQARMQYHGKKGEEYWVAVADLTLQIDEQAALTPSFSHIFASTIDWGLKLDTQAQRVYTQSIQYIIPELRSKKCESDIDPNGQLLAGKLGLDEVVKMAFDSIAPNEDKDKGLALYENKQKSASFGTSIQFVITKNVNSIGPTWTLAHFKGPGKLFLAQRTDTHKLSISFALGSPGQLDKALSQAKESNKQLQINNLQLRLN